MSKSGNRLFGVTADKESKGVLGWREYCWAVKMDGVNRYRFMTETEKEKFKEIVMRYYKKDFEVTIREGLLRDAYKKGELNDTEFANAMMEFDYFHMVIEATLEELNIRIVRATRHEVENSERMEFLMKNNEAE